MRLPWYDLEQQSIMILLTTQSGHCFWNRCFTIWVMLAAAFILCLGYNPPWIWAEDLDDCALLFDSNQMENSDVNFKKICQFYGLRCREIDLRLTDLTEELLRDANGQYLTGIGVNAKTLEKEEPVLLDSTELAILKEAVSDGAHLLISNFCSAMTNDLSATRQLTDDQVVGVSPSFVNLNWIVSDHQPEITREFSGQTIPFWGADCASSPVVDGSTMVLVSSLDKDNPEIEYPNFVGFPLGSGTIFVDGGNQRQSLEYLPMRGLYDSEYFYNIVPTMMFIRFAGGDECWHNDLNYANLTIDDPNLSDMHYGDMNFQDVLTEMEAHGFFTTIGLIPRDYRNFADQVVTLFWENPDRYSIVQHGNNHDGFEFFAYDSAGSLAVCLERGWCDHSPRTLIEQEADIVEGATRIAEFERLTDLLCEDVMIFPCGISPMATLGLLKAYNFTATVNGQSVPIGEESGQNYDFNLRPLNMNYANFACSPRRHWQQDQRYLFDFFIDNPVLIYEHDWFFENGPDAFNNAAASINGISGSVEWMSLGYIIKHLHLKKRNDDGTISVAMYTNDLIISNEMAEAHIYHIQKEETFNVPILSLTVDGIPATYSLLYDTLHVTVTIPSGASRKIEIRYGSGNKDFAISNEDIHFDPQVSDTLSVTVHNYGTDGGPVPIQFFDGHPDSGAVSLDLVTIERIEPGSSKVIKRVPGEMISGIHLLYIILDPYDVISETDEENNVASATVSVLDELVLDDFEYEDSPLNHGWAIDAGSGELTVVFDSTLNSRVMQVTTCEGTGFRISHTGYDLPKTLFSLKIKATDFFVLYVRVQTTVGEYYLQYTPDAGADTSSGSYVFFHLGSSYQDSTWHSLQRDLAVDVSSLLDASFSRVKKVVLRGSYQLDDLVLSAPSSDIDQEPAGEGPTPDAFSLFANYPNPFNSGTTLTYHLSREDNVKLSIYNIHGQRVVTLVDDTQPVGVHRSTWDGQDSEGLPVASGVYFCALKVGHSKKVQKMVLLR